MSEKPRANPKNHKESKYRLVLFVAGDRPNSRQARSNLERFCRDTLNGCAEVTVVDVCEDYKTAAEHKVFLTPCLVVRDPVPGAHIVGNLSDIRAIKEALHIET
jgi:circadian clock protein KaiB